ncbi:MAG: hypothetical protein R6V53_04710, partial [Candidatus Woesearchaeota archaeon]
FDKEHDPNAKFFPETFKTGYDTKQIIAPIENKHREDWNFIKNNKVEKPTECGNGACICLIEKKEILNCRVFDEEIVLAGHTFDQFEDQTNGILDLIHQEENLAFDDLVQKPLPQNQGKSKDIALDDFSDEWTGSYGYLFLLGHQEYGWWDGTKGPGSREGKKVFAPFGNRNIYLEKMEYQGTTYILLAPLDLTDDFNEYFIEYRKELYNEEGKKKKLTQEIEELNEKLNGQGEPKEELEEALSETVKSEETFIHEHFRPFVWENNWKDFWLNLDGTDLEDTINDLTEDDIEVIIRVMSQSSMEHSDLIIIRGLFGLSEQQINSLEEEKEEYYLGWWSEEGEKYIKVQAYGYPKKLILLTDEGIEKLYELYEDKTSLYEELYQKCKKFESEYGDSEMCDITMCIKQMDVQTMCICEHSDGIEACRIGKCTDSGCK